MSFIDYERPIMDKHLIRSRAGVLISAVLVSVNVAAQSLQLHTERQPWEASAGASPIVVTDLLTNDAGQSAAQAQGSYSSITFQGVTFHNVWWQSDGSFVTHNSFIDISLKPGTYGFGLNLAPIYPLDPPSPKTYTFTLSNGQVFTSTALTQTFSQEFRGIAGGSAISSVRIGVEAGPLYIEDFRYYLAAAMPPPAQVSIDVRPDSPQNVVNPRAQGNLPVAILGSATFAVSTVDTTSLRFGATGAEDSIRNYNIYDVNSDGFPDLMLDVANGETGVASSTKRVKLTGKTTLGVQIEGEDGIRIRPER